MIRRIETAETSRRCLELRRDGLAYREIAEQLGISTGAAHNYVQRELADVPAADRIALRDLEAARLDALQALAWPQAKDGDLAAIRECRAISESRRKLFGLDAPQQVDVRGAEPVDIMGTARKILAQIDGGDEVDDHE